jgi:23S rRNA pseudouridine2605 synthase
LAQHGYGSRRLMEEWITQGRVEINGKKAEIGARVGKGDALLVDGKPVGKRGAPARLLMYHKPPGKIVERKEGGNTVFDDLPPLAVGKWHNIGRLDVATEGLLLFTTDGDFVEKMAHPSFGIEREYRARANGVLSAQTLSQICRDGVALGETSHARPLLFEREEQPATEAEAKAEAANGNGNDETPPPPMTAESAQDWQSMEAEEGAGQNPCWYRVIVNEGRNRLVRRLFETQGLSVSCLLRVRFGEYRLPPDLPSGNWKELPPPK